MADKINYVEQKSTIYNIKYVDDTDDDYGFYENRKLRQASTRRVPYLDVKLQDFPEINFFDKNIYGDSGEYVSSIGIENVNIKELFTGFKVEIDLFIPFNYYEKYRNKSISRVEKRTRLSKNQNFEPARARYNVENGLGELNVETYDQTIVYSNFLDVITTPGHIFEISFGWNITDSPRFIGKIFRAVLVRSNLKFDQTTKGVKLRLTLASVYATVLGSIPINALELDIKTLRSINSTNDMLKLIFSKSKAYCEKYRGELSRNVKNFDIANDVPDIDNIVYNLYNNSDEVTTNNPTNFVMADSAESVGEKYMSLSDYLQITPKSIDAISHSIVNIITNKDTDESVTVIEVLNRACMENNFFIRFTPLLNKKQIIISNVTNNFKTVDRKIYNPGEVIDAGKDIVKIFEYSFDIFSRNNNFISMNVETESGEQSMMSAMASAKFGSGDIDEFSLKENYFDEINSYYDQWLMNSKKINTTMIGSPNFDLWDLVKIDFYEDTIGSSTHKLLSGYYFILEVSHAFTNGKFTTDVSAVRLAEKMLRKNVIEEVESTPVVSKEFKEFSRKYLEKYSSGAPAYLSTRR
jgi:hypothetical protein